MLKIKDNVDLKEIDKLIKGGHYDKSVDKYYLKKLWIDKEGITTEYVNGYLSITDIDKMLDIIYDLIKSDLVEKID
ncbi:MAG: hypothetical protein E7166_00425 [Firmicutes bacterium]|nr:hypothetical protein [Bacillota bacterium]